VAGACPRTVEVPDQTFTVGFAPAVASTHSALWNSRSGVGCVASLDLLVRPVETCLALATASQVHSNIALTCNRCTSRACRSDRAGRAAGALAVDNRSLTAICVCCSQLSAHEQQNGALLIECLPHRRRHDYSGWRSVADVDSVLKQQDRAASFTSVELQLQAGRSSFKPTCIDTKTLPSFDPKAGHADWCEWGVLGCSLSTWQAWQPWP
jgi:hypothetical protein